MDTSVRAFARLRPSSAGQELIKLPRRFDQQKNVQVRNLEFSLDWVFDEDATQADVFEMVGDGYIDQLLQGYNVTFMAYGQTGSGKTYTIFGPDEVLTQFASSERSLHGIAPSACEQLFEEIAGTSEETSSAWLVQCTYLEVYNGTVNDLLGDRRKNLVLRETPENGLYVEGLTHEVVSDAEQAMKALAQGNSVRTVGAMKMNERSSRGHAIFSLRLQEVSQAGVWEGEGDPAGQATAKLELVDLAGWSRQRSLTRSTAPRACKTAERRRSTLTPHFTPWVR